MLADILIGLFDLIVKLAPDTDLHAHLDAAMVRRAKAIKQAADDAAFG